METFIKIGTTLTIYLGTIGTVLLLGYAGAVLEKEWMITLWALIVLVSLSVSAIVLIEFNEKD